MRICFLMPNHWSAAIGGAEIQVRFVMENLQRHSDHELVMICRNSNVVEEGRAKIYQTSPFRPLAKYFMSCDYLSVRRLLKHLRPEVVYTRTSTAYVGFAAQYCRDHNARLIYHIAHIDDVRPNTRVGFRTWPKRIDRRFYEYGLRRADQIIAQTAEQADLLCKNYGLRCTAVIRNFHPAPSFVQKPHGALRVVWVANLKPAKRPELFVDLARRFLHRDDVEFIMIGAIQNPKYAHFQEQSTLPRNTSYLGPLDLEQVNKQLDMSHLLINTSSVEGEGFPNTFIQAWLRRITVASLEVNPDAILVPASTGVACGGSFERLITTIATLISDRDKLFSMGQKAYQIARTEFGEKQCQTLISMLETES